MANNGLFGSLKRAVVGIIGRDRANKLTAPYYDRQARRRTERCLASLPSRDLLVNLGCGYRPMAGWINVDHARGSEVQVVWDVTRNLPFPDASCAAVFSEHMIEHIPKGDAQRLLEECHRVLGSGGVLRISTPDAEKFLRSYAGDQSFLGHPSFSEPIDAPIDRVNHMMREHGQHLWAYDEELLTMMLSRAGFSRITRQRFGQSAHPRMNGIDFEQREIESLYMEAVKD